MSEEIRAVDALSIEDVKHRLPLAWAAARLGVFLDAGRARCPFHDDHEPSFRIWTDDSGEEKWSCDPCGLRAHDVYDLAERMLGTGFGGALAWARDALAELPDDTASYAAPVQAKPFDPTEVEQARVNAQQDPRTHFWLGRFIDEQHPELAGAFLASIYGWGSTGTTTYMPHWDTLGVMRGCKIREGNRKRSIDGSKYSQLYGAWLPRRNPAVLLVEGESDAAWAGWRIHRHQLPYDVYALPSGAPSLRQRGGPEHVIELLQGAKSITLAFDPDPAGQEATVFWHDLLSEADFQVLLAKLPRGLDLRAADPDLKQLLDSALRRRRSNSKLIQEHGAWWIPSGEGDRRPIASWTAEPRATLVPGPGEDDAVKGLSVLLNKDGRFTPDIMLNADLRTKAALSGWANPRSVVWKGSDSDANDVAEHLFSRTSYIPEVFVSKRVGLHLAPERYAYAGPSLVLPTNPEVGKLPWELASGAYGEDRVDFPSGGTSLETIEAFAALGPAALTSPILAWLAAAARRHEVRDFPMLFVSGPSGSGKSTISRVAQAMFGSRLYGNLAQLTPFVLMQLLSASTTVPIFLDEYTRQSGAAVDSFRGDVPVLYEGGVAMRGQQDLSVRSWRLTSPTIVAGENLFTNTREIERSIVVEARRTAQNHDALTALTQTPYKQFALAYAKFIVQSPQLLHPFPSPDATDRIVYNRQILEAGWHDLHIFCSQAFTAIPLPDDIDFSIADDQASQHEEPYEDAVREVLATPEPGRVEIVKLDERGTLVQFAKCVKRYETITGEMLPGGAQAMQRYFQSTGRDVEKVKAYSAGTRTYYWLIRGWWPDGAPDAQDNFQPDGAGVQA